MNKDLLQDMKNLTGRKWLLPILFAVLFLTYGYFLTHSTIGMDDTAIETYFVDGFAPYVGRWTLFLLNFIFDFATFTPFFTDALGVAFLGLSAYLFCVLWERISNKKIHPLSLIAFACLFVTYPLIGEVYIFYLHNGISLSFVFMAFCGFAWWDYLQTKKAKNLLWITLFLSLSIGCYESFATVYMVLLCGIYLLGIVKGSLQKQKCKIWIKDILFALIPLILSMLIRTVMYTLICACLGLETSARGMSALQLWLVNPPLVLLKDLFYQFLMRFVLNGKYIFGISVYVISSVVFILSSLIYMTGKKKWSMLPFGIAILAAPWMLIFLQLVITPYRATQALMLFISFTWLLCAEYLLQINFKKYKKAVQIVFALLLMVVTFRQGFSLHHYFYMDAVKEDYNRAYCHDLARELTRDYDTTKPVIFIGQRDMPQGLQPYFYLATDTPEYYNFIHTANLVYTPALTNFADSRYGYRIYDIACTDTLDWMSYSDLQDGEYEIYRYMEMLGYEFCYPPKEVIIEARQKALEDGNYPIWPAQGSILEDENYIYVYLGKVYVNF